MVPATPANKYPGAIITDDSDKPAQPTTQRGPGAISTTHIDNRTEIDKIAAQRNEGIFDPEANAPQVEDIPEIPGEFKFTTPVHSVKANTEFERVKLRPATARQLMYLGEFITPASEKRRDPRTGTIVEYQTVKTDYAVLAKHIAEMTSFTLEEIEKISAFDMNRLKDRIYDMMYQLPKK